MVGDDCSDGVDLYTLFALCMFVLLVCSVGVCELGLVGFVTRLLGWY